DPDSVQLVLHVSLGAGLHVLSVCGVRFGSCVIGSVLAVAGSSLASSTSSCSRSCSSFANSSSSSCLRESPTSGALCPCCGAAPVSFGTADGRCADCFMP